METLQFDAWAIATDPPVLMFEPVLIVKQEAAAIVMVLLN